MKFKQELASAISAVIKASTILSKYATRSRTPKFKGEINLVTEADQHSQSAIIKILKKDFPQYGILSEENFETRSDSAIKWIVDPLDGTTNYAHNLPVYSISIALEVEQKIVLGVVYNPNLDELFFAVAGCGAYLNNKRISVSKTKTLNKSLLATGFPYDIRESQNNNLNHFNNFAVRAQAIRRGGSACLDLCYLAGGRFDGFWELKLAPWDMAAGYLMVEEAGGKVTDFKNRQFHINKKEMLASNRHIHGEMLKVLNKRKITNF